MGKPQIKEAEQIAQAEYSLKQIEAVIDKYWEFVQASKTPAMVDVFDLKNYIKQNI